MLPFEEILTKRWENSPEKRDRIILALDPGETTGLAVMSGATLLVADQLSTGIMPVAAVRVADAIDKYNPELIILEDYKVYAWKTECHAWQSLHTSRLIGAIEYIAYRRNTPYRKQMAQTGKSFCSDEKLQTWGFYQAKKPHARDAIRHACHFLLFGPESK